MLKNGSVWGIVAIVAIAFLLALAFQLSPTARLKRRLKKTHSRIKSKTSRPTVKFSVKVPKK